MNTDLVPSYLLLQKCEYEHSCTSILWKMLSFSLGKWSESLRSGMVGLFGLFNFFRKLNCALIHIFISSELNLQFLYNFANIQAALWKAGMLFSLSLPPKGDAPSCAPSANCHKQRWYSKLYPSLFFVLSGIKTVLILSVLQMRQSHPRAALHKAGKLHTYSILLLPHPPRRGGKLRCPLPVLSCAGLGERLTG